MMTVESERQAALAVEVEVPSPSVVVVQLCGAANADEVDVLTRHLQSAVTQDARFVILDLARLNFLSPAALGCLDEFRRGQAWLGGEVWLAGLQPAVWLAFHAAGLGGRFPVRDSVAQIFAC
jgi:serine/threonine-protein kinase RsbW